MASRTTTFPSLILKLEEPRQKDAFILFIILLLFYSESQLQKAGLRNKGCVILSLYVNLWQ